jgi:acetyl-CoA carboxylase biotin carboxyl carrier protein
VPEGARQRDGDAAGSDAARLADHAGIARLAEDLLPALIAKLSTTQLGELEVREGDWQVRLRRPYGVGPGEGRRVTDKASRTQPGHEGHGHGRAGVEGQRASRGAGSGSGSASGGSSGGSPAAAASSGSNGVVASSPAVGIFNPGQRAASGTRVRAGDVLGTVNMLGIPQDIASPADGIVGATLVEAGTAVEYGQELIRLEMTGPSSGAQPGGEGRG